MISKLHFRLFISIIFCILCSTTEAAKIIQDSIRIGGQMRRYHMFLPEGIKKGAPLVFVLHGYGSDCKPDTWMNDVAEEEGFAICIPQSLIDPNKHHAWNVGYGFQKGWKVNDVKAMCRMAKIVQKKYELSEDNTFFTGMSNGGEMCYLMAYQNQTTFKAIGSLAGLTMSWMYKDLKMERPVPFLEIHGTEDRVSEWFGDKDNEGGWGAYIPVPIAVNKIVTTNKCYTLELKTTTSYRENGHKTIRHYYSNPETGNDVWLYEIIGGKHSWLTEDIDTGREIWTFFKRYIK